MAIPLSSIRQPREQLGQAAAELLLEEISVNGHHRHRQVLFRPEPVARASSEHPRRAGSREGVRVARAT